MTAHLPKIAFVLTLAGVAMTLLPAGTVRDFDVDAFGRLPTLEGGRVKPLDSVARNSLLVIRSQQGFRHKDRRVTANEWLLDVMFRPKVADDQPAFVVNDPDVLGLLGLKQTSDRYFSFNTMVPRIQEIAKQAKAAHAVEEKQRSRFQAAVANLYERMVLYHGLKNTVQLLGGRPLAAELADMNGEGAEETRQALMEFAQFRLLSPPPGAPDEDWRNVGEALRDAARTGEIDPGLPILAGLAQAWATQDVSAFNNNVIALRQVSQTRRPGALSEADAEHMFNKVQPFYVGMVIYVLALLLVFGSWLGRPTLLQPLAFSILLAGSFVHTGGLIWRVILQGRPPVTNLYSSAVFVGWGAVVLGVVLERMYRKGFGTAVAAASGFASLIVAHHLASDGDTMEMMRAVLDSNFWLATHVVTITIGYSGAFLAGAIAIAYTLRKHLARSLERETTRVLVGMVYGVIAFALLFSFIGTVLGGIWADQSWGRFWGWDPKENGALLIVLWNATILHARWGGFIRDRGIMAMAIFGNVITSLSWFGVNMLGVGLHSYGFMDNAVWALGSFIAVQLGLIVLTLLPRKFWQGGAAASGAAS